MIKILRGQGQLYNESIYAFCHSGAVPRNPKTGAVMRIESRGSIQYTSLPYLLPGLRPGKYTVVLVSPAPPSVTGINALEVEVGEGSIAEAIFVLEGG